VTAIILSYSIGCGDSFDSSPQLYSGSAVTMKAVFEQPQQFNLSSSVTVPKWLGPASLCGVDVSSEGLKNLQNTQDCISNIKDFKVKSVRIKLDKIPVNPFEIYAVETVNDGSGINKKLLLEFNDTTCSEGWCEFTFDNFSYMSNIDRLKKIYSEGFDEWYYPDQYHPKYTPLTFVLGQYNEDVKGMEFYFTVEAIF